MIMRLSLIVTLVFAASAWADVSVKEIDFLTAAGLSTNAAGPVLVRWDAAHDRLIVAHTLSSAISVIDGKSHAVENIPLGGRALQHLKADALAIRRKTGEVCLIGTKCVSVASPEARSARTIPTDVQFESVAVDEETGNVFLAGRESREIGFLKAGSEKLKTIPWRETREDLINLNQTPPPPVRKVVAANELGQILAVDGYTSTLSLFDAKSGKHLGSRNLGLPSGGRWHLAGYDEKAHCLFLVTETVDRRVTHAARVDVAGGGETIVALPGFTEGVGMIYNPRREEVYIPYDNHPSVHAVRFEKGGEVTEMKIPAYGNDANALDAEDDFLYIGSWAHGEVDVVDLATRRLVKRIQDLGIVPHMFAMTMDPTRDVIYFPRGATAVNGAFGASVMALDLSTEETQKIYTGWAPVDLIEMKERGSILVFNSEDQFAEVHRDGSFELFDLPCDHPVKATHSPVGDVYLSYGHHQTYWPVVYIWGAKNGILTINSGDLSFYDRRIPRQAHTMVLDEEGVLYFTQNNWGREEQFLGTLKDEVRLFEPGERIALADTVEREITQRLLSYDPDARRLYLARVGETDEDPSILQVIDPRERTVEQRIELGCTATDLAFDDHYIYVTDFDSKNVTVVDKMSYEKSEIGTGEGPLRLCRVGEVIYCINHLGKSLTEVSGNGETYEIPFEGMPDNLFSWKGRIIIASHSHGALSLIEFDPRKESFALLHEEDYPYGETRFDTRNVSFYMRGQFGDALFAITQAKEMSDGSLWITDFLSGKLFILTE
jgi:DNA-binding beta-propeller fold protein YncE